MHHLAEHFSGSCVELTSRVCGTILISMRNTIKTPWLPSWRGSRSCSFYSGSIWDHHDRPMHALEPIGLQPSIIFIAILLHLVLQIYFHVSQSHSCLSKVHWIVLLLKCIQIDLKCVFNHFKNDFRRKNKFHTTSNS